MLLFLLAGCAGNPSAPPETTPEPIVQRQAPIETKVAELVQAVAPARDLNLGTAVATPSMRVKEWLLEPSVVTGWAARKSVAVRLDTGAVFGPFGGRFNLGPAGWVQDGRDVDAVVSLKDGSVINLLARYPSGTSSNTDLKLLPHPAAPRIHLFGTDGGVSYSAVWRPGDDRTVPMSHVVPFAPTMGTASGADHIALDFEKMRSGATGCVSLSLPEDGKSTCITERPAAATSQHILADGVVLLGLADGSIVLERRDVTESLLEPVDCPSPTLDAYSQQPQRAILFCQETGKVFIWSPETLWSAPAPEGYTPREHVAGARVLPNGEPLEPRTRWLSLDSGALIETPPLKARAHDNLPWAQFAGWTDDGALYWVDLAASTVTHVGDARCPGQLTQSMNSERVVECVDDSFALVASHIIGDAGWWTSPHRVQQIQSGMVLLSNETSDGMRGESTKLWTVKLHD